MTKQVAESTSDAELQRLRAAIRQVIADVEAPAVNGKVPIYLGRDIVKALRHALNGGDA